MDGSGERMELWQKLVFLVFVLCFPSVFCKGRMLFLLGVVCMAITNINCFILRCCKNACVAIMILQEYVC